MAWAANAAAGEVPAFRWQDLVGILVSHGHGPKRGHGVQPAGRSAARRAQSADPVTPLARGDARRGDRGGVHGRRARWVSWPGRSCFCRETRCRFTPRRRCCCFCSDTVSRSGSRCSSHFWLGAALMLAPVAAWVAIRAEVAWPPVVLGAAVMLWVAGFDIIYACQDVAFDTQMRLRSIPARLGVARALRVAAACHLGMVLLLALLAVVYPGFGWIYRARASRRSPCCWSTNTRSFAPTTSPASIARSSTSTPW